MHPKTTKHNKTWVFFSNRVDRVRPLRKIPMWLRGTNFCIKCTSSPRFALSFMQLRNDPKCTQTIWNAPKHEFRFQWGGSGRSLWKSQCEFVAQIYVLIVLVQYVLQQVSCSYETIPTAPKALWNTPKHEFRVQWGESVSSLRKIQCDFVAQTFVLIDPIQYVLKQVSCSYGTIPNAPKYYETYQNISLGSNWVDLVVHCENHNVNSWYKLMY